MADEDLYVLLGVAPHATVNVIRGAYRALARTMHPDLGGDSHRMAALNAAWSVLRDPLRRAEYDARRVSRTREPESDGSSVLDFGRYAGSSIRFLGRRDPDYLEWLARTQIGRPFRREIEDVLREWAEKDAKRRASHDLHRTRPRRWRSV
jgi:curved DNA-binding protein CbpA